MMFVNVLLKIQTLISKLCQCFVGKMKEAFAMQKLFSYFNKKNICVSGYKIVKHLTNWPLNELVTITML